MEDLALEARRNADPRGQLSIVYLNSDAGEEGRTEVESILSEIPGIYFVDQEETLTEFIAFSDADPELLNEMRVEQMPPSWRVDRAGEPLPAEIRSILEMNEYVRRVAEPVQ